MAVQVSYPGIYIEEFAPGAPIEGVGTSKAAFIGTAASGPIDKPTLIQSWDAFKATFGDFIAGPSTGYLGPAVYGFFLNGGTTCYVLRHGTGVKAFAGLDSRQAGANPPPALAAAALQEGAVGNSLQVEVKESSILADKGAAHINIQSAGTDILSIGSDRMTLTVADNSGFAPGDWVLLTDSNDATASAVVESLQANKIILSGPVDAALDFSGGKVRTADLAAGRCVIRLVVPSALTLSTALPRGAMIKITGYDSNGDKISEVCSVESAGGDQVTVSTPLENTYSLADASKPATVESLEFDLIVTDTSSGKSESFLRLAMGADHPNYWRANVVSQFISLALPAVPPIVDDLRPKEDVYSLADGEPDDASAAWGEIRNNPDEYLSKLNAIDEISLVCIPGATDQGVQQAMITHCEAAADRFAILDSDPDAVLQTIPNQLANVVSAKGYAALYFPWILAHNPVSKKDAFWPPSGHIAGIYARSDAERGVHKAPANVAVRGALGLQQRLTDAEQGRLNLKGINVLRVFQGQAQPVVWGARTTASDRNWQYVNIRRLFIFLERSIEEGIRWAVFEPNNLQLWQKLKRTITDFLTRVWRDGALFGAKAEEAFYVRIDEALNPESTRKLGRLYLEIGVCPTYPAEFIVVRIGIWDGGSQISET